MQGRKSASHDTIFKWNKMIKSSVITFLFLSVFFNTVKAQVFWTEYFDSVPCNSGCKALSYGKWKVDSMGLQGSSSNEWFVSCAEEGKKEGDCSSGCKRKNNSLHITNRADGRAFDYTRGNANGITDKRAVSPLINLTGKSNVRLIFDYICLDDSIKTQDSCKLELSVDGGNTWFIFKPNLTTTSCHNADTSMWRLFDEVLPAFVNNKPQFKFGFHWKNNDNKFIGPAFSVDSIRLSSSNPLTTNPISGGPFCACSTIKVPFTATGPMGAGNVFTAELSNAAGSFAVPVVIGSLSSTALNDSISATIPCNTPPGTGYKIRVKSSNPLIIGSEVSIVISAPIQVIVTPNPDTVCSGDKVILKANGGTKGTYNWMTLPTSPITNADSIIVTPVINTSYVVYGNKGSCKDTTIAKVFVDLPPVVKVTNDTTCVGLGAVIKASGGTKYLWPDGSKLDSLIVFPVTKDTSVTVIVTKGHCSVKATGFIKVYPTITISVTKDTSICAGQSILLKANGAINYVWNTVPPKTGSSILVTPVTTTSYTVTGTAGSCKDDAVVKVTVSPKPDVYIDTVAAICQGQSVQLKAHGSEAGYFWLFPTNPPNNTKDTTTIKPILSGFYKVVGISLAGCVDTGQVLVKVNMRPNVEVLSDTICLGGTANLVAFGAETYLWETGETNDTLKVSPSPEGIYKYKVYGYNGTCADTAYGFVTVGKPVPVVISGKTEIFSCESTQLFALPADGTYSWGNVGNGDGTIDCNTCSTTLVTPPTTQAFYVVYTSPFGCIGKDTIQVTVININSYFIPTGFSPNGDGINDVVQVHGKGVDHISLKIFDRIGEKVFETNELETGWDGTYHGLLMNDNVFVYKLEIYYCSGETIKETGNITLLK
jgi:gliding motility-associated-like protein